MIRDDQQKQAVSIRDHEAYKSMAFYQTEFPAIDSISCLYAVFCLLPIADL